MVAAVVAAFIPVMGVDFALDAYVRAQTHGQLEQVAEREVARLEAPVQEALDAVSSLALAAAGGCATSFTSGAQREVEQGLYLRQIMVERLDGSQSCGAFGRGLGFNATARPVTLDDGKTSVTVGRFEQLAAPALRISREIDAWNRISAIVPALPPSSNGLSDDATVRVVLADADASLGSDGVTAGDAGELVTATASSSLLPVQVDAAMPFATARAAYNDLDATFTLIAALLSGACLVLGLQLALRANLLAFELRRAIRAGEIKPYYQPVVDLETGRLTGCEVLCRWEKKNGQVLTPGSFIELAEATGLAIPMTESMMRQIGEDLETLCREMPGLKVSINLFEGHFRDEKIIENVQQIFRKTIPYTQLVFEITERRPLEKLGDARKVIAGLHALGCRLAIDDAGTGHSSLAYLQTLGADVVKIDRVFVEMIGEGQSSVPVLDGLINMAKDLGLDTVAEGVEEKVQADYLLSRGVVNAQGFLFAPALKASVFKDMARRERPVQIPQAA